MATQEDLNQAYDIFMENVTWLRKTHGLSKTEMAKLLHISVKSLNRMEQGEMPPGTSAKILFRIQDIFDIHPAELLCRKLDKSRCE